MPLYDVKCEKCEHQEEVLARINVQLVCSKCGAQTKKQIGLSSFRLEGGGWGKDLYSKPATKSKDR